jgi:N-acetylated-alpha-linked acidic dipeptidase
MKKWAICAILFTLAAAVGAADGDALAGYAAASAKTEQDWEAKFRAIPDAANLRAYMQRLTARPHHVGSPYDKENDKRILSK